MFRVNKTLSHVVAVMTFCLPQIRICFRMPPNHFLLVTLQPHDETTLPPHAVATCCNIARNTLLTSVPNSTSCSWQRLQWWSYPCATSAVGAAQAGIVATSHWKRLVYTEQVRFLVRDTRGDACDLLVWRRRGKLCVRMAQKRPEFR